MEIKDGLILDQKLESVFLTSHRALCVTAHSQNRLFDDVKNSPQFADGILSGGNEEGDGYQTVVFQMTLNGVRKTVLA